MSKQSLLKYNAKNHQLGRKMILPAVIAMVLVHYLPMVWGLYISFRNYNKFTIRKMPWQVDFTGLKNYASALTSLEEGFSTSLSITLSYVVISIILCVFLGLIAAVLANSCFRGRTIYRGIMLIPYILPKVVYLTCFRFMFTHDGIINSIITKLFHLSGEAPYWLIGKNSFWTIVIGNVWGAWPLFYLIFLAALQTIPKGIYDSASIDGASVWQKFRFITIPHIKGSIVIVVLLNILWSYNDYIVPYIMLGGGYSIVPKPASLLAIQIIRESFDNLNFGLGAAESTMMTLVASVFVVFYLKKINIDGNGIQKNRRNKSIVRFMVYIAIAGFFVVILKQHFMQIIMTLGAVLFLSALIVSIMEISEKKGVKILSILGRLFFLLLILFPVYWLVISSLKSESEIRLTNFIPSQIVWSNYADAFKLAPLGRYFVNSSLISITAMIFSIVLATLAGYAFSRFRFKGHKLFGMSVLVTQMFPGVLFLLPYFLIFTNLQRTPLFKWMGWKFIGPEVYSGNIFLLIFTYMAFTLPFCIWVFRGFIDTVPEDLDRAAEVDGCTRFQSFLRIVIPSALPGITTIAILAFMQGWNEVLFSSVLTNPTTRTIALGIQDYRTQQVVQWNTTMAAGVIISLPVVLFFTLMQNQLVSGLTAGAVKE